MSERMFDPSNAKYEKVEDLPKKEQSDFANIEEGGFVRKEAKKEFDDAKKIVELANLFKEAGIDIKELLDKRRRPIMREIGQALRDDKTAMDILQDRAEAEKLKPIDALHIEANDIHAQKYPEEIYLEKLKNDPDDLKGIPKRIWNNKRFAMEAVKINSKSLDKMGYGQNSLGGNDYVEVVYEAVRHDGLALQYAGNKSRANKDIVLESAKQNPNAIKFASKDIKEAIKRIM
jgi:hypothetical protein